jgi:hypothetical protein
MAKSRPPRWISKYIAFELGSQLQHLDPQAFVHASIKSICVPASVLTVGGKHDTFPASTIVITFEAGSRVRGIEERLFLVEMHGCVILPASLESINGRRVFPDDSSGTFLHRLPIYALEPGNGHFRIAGRTLTNFTGTVVVRYFGDMPLPPLDSRVEELGPRSFAGWPMTLFAFCYASRLRFIGQEAFIGCKLLESIEVPGTVEVIGEGAFRKCEALCDVRIAGGSRLRLIERDAFKGCRRLQPVAVPASATIRGAFEVLGQVFAEDGSERSRVRFIVQGSKE